MIIVKLSTKVVLKKPNYLRGPMSPLIPLDPFSPTKKALKPPVKFYLKRLYLDLPKTDNDFLIILNRTYKLIILKTYLNSDNTKFASIVK